MPKLNNLLQITEIIPVGNVLLSHANKVINPGFNLLGRGGAKKTFKVAFSFTGQATALFKVVFKGPVKQYQGASLQAVTPDKKVRFSGTLTGTTALLSAAFQPSDHQRSHFSKLTWQLCLTGQQPLNLANSALDIYWVPEPSTTHTLNAKGMPVEMLVHMSAMALGDPATPKDLADQVFNFNPPRYDTLHGRTFFTSFKNFDNITLLYQAYLAAANEPGAVMNCYDAAAVLQYLLQQNNIPANFIFLQPFGFLRLTNLIGRGQCDNPFYQYEGNAPVVDPTDPDRTSFGNHAFIQLTASQLIADACAGPHEGVDTPDQYVASAIDTQVPVGTTIPSGTTANMVSHTGVTSVDTLQSGQDQVTLPHAASFSKLFDWSKGEQMINAGGGVAAKWPGPLQCRSLKVSWKVVYSDTIPGSAETLRYWLLSSGAALLTVRLYVSSGGKAIAKDRFIAACSLTQQQEHHLTPKALPGQEGYAAADEKDEGVFTCWWYENIAMEFLSSAPVGDLPVLAEWYHRFALKSRVDHLDPYFPATDMLFTRGALRQGDPFHVTLNSPHADELHFRPRAGAPALVSASARQLVFKAGGPFKGQMELFVLDPITLLVSQKMIPVQVKSK